MIEEATKHIESMLRQQDVQIDAIRKSVVKTEHILEGNGRPGLIVEVALLRDAEDKRAKAARDAQRARDGLFVAILSAGLTNLAAMIAGIWYIAQRLR